jgi:hypothetical protein
MSDQEKKQKLTTPLPRKPDAENKKESEELSEEELKDVSGGIIIEGGIIIQGSLRS